MWDNSKCVVWHAMVWYDMVWYGMVRYGTVRYVEWVLYGQGAV